VTDEGWALVEKVVEGKGMRYPVARIKATVDRTYGVSGFPSAALVGPDGRVVWKGHPGSLPEGTIREALEGALYVAPLGEDFGKIDKLLAKREYGEAWEEIVDELEDAPEHEALLAARDRIVALADRLAARAAAAVEAGRPGPAWADYVALEERFEGLPQAEAAEDARKALEKDKATTEAVDAWEDLLKADEVQAEGDFEKAAKRYERIVKKYEGTEAAQRAQEFLRRHPS
jgi:hypothetical protein